MVSKHCKSVVLALIFILTIVIFISLKQIEFEREWQVIKLDAFNGILFVPNDFFIVLEESKNNQILLKKADGGTICLVLRKQISDTEIKEYRNKADKISQNFGLTHIYYDEKLNQQHIYFDDIYVIYFINVDHKIIEDIMSKYGKIQELIKDGKYPNIYEARKNALEK